MIIRSVYKWEGLRREKLRHIQQTRFFRAFENVVNDTLEGKTAISNDSPFFIPWSDDIESEYGCRLKDLFAKPNIADRARDWIRRNGGRLKLKLSHIIRPSVER